MIFLTPSRFRKERVLVVTMDPAPRPVQRPSEVFGHAAIIADLSRILTRRFAQSRLMALMSRKRGIRYQISAGSGSVTSRIRSIRKPASAKASV